MAKHKQRKNLQRKHIDVYQRVTDEIVGYLEKGVRPWSASWVRSAGGLPLRVCGTPYRGVNVLLLWMAQVENGFTSDSWMTFRQAKAVGANVRKGEKGCAIIRSGTYDLGEGEEAVTVPFLRQYVVFNFSQIENLPDDLQVRVAQAESVSEESAAQSTPNASDELLCGIGAKINSGGETACYRPGPDDILMPRFEDFRDADAFTATLAHELVHWTGSPKRLARIHLDENPRMAYAREELVAEIGAAFVCARLGVATKEREDHASYIDGWLRLLKSDKRAVQKAAAMAQSACDYLLGDTSESQELSAEVT